MVRVDLDSNSVRTTTLDFEAGALGHAAGSLWVANPGCTTVLRLADDDTELLRAHATTPSMELTTTD